MRASSGSGLGTGGARLEGRIEAADLMRRRLQPLADDPGQAEQDPVGHGRVFLRQLQQVGAEQADKLGSFEGACRCGTGSRRGVV